MLLVGSRSLSRFIQLGRIPDDWDIWVDESETEVMKSLHPGVFRQTGPRKYHGVIEGNRFEISVITKDSGTNAAICERAKSLQLDDVWTPVGMARSASPEIHKLLKRSSLPLGKIKNELDLKLLSGYDDIWPDILDRRIEETIARVSEMKQAFFGQKIKRYITHDSLHEFVSSQLGVGPIYKQIVTDGYMAQYDLFELLSDELKLSCLAEEAIVLAIERAYIPHIVKHRSNIFTLWRTRMLKLECSSDPAQLWMDRLCSPGRVNDQPEWMACYGAERYQDLKTMVASYLSRMSEMPAGFWTAMVNIRNGNVDETV